MPPRRSQGYPTSPAPSSGISGAENKSDRTIKTYLEAVRLLEAFAEAGHPLKPRTIQTALAELDAPNLAAGSEEGSGRVRYWSPTTPNLDAESAGGGQPGDGGGAGMA